jgi:WD40 repeat protein
LIASFAIIPATAVSQPPEQSAKSQISTDVRADALGDPLPEKALLRFGTRRFQHPSSPAQILLSKDQKSVLSLSDDLLIAWDAVTGKELWRKNSSMSDGGVRIGAAGYGVQPLAIIPETGEFVTGARPGQIAFWNPATGESQKIQVGHGMRSKSVAVSPDSNRIALGDANQLMVCNREGQEIYKIANQPASPMAFGGDDRDRLKFGGDFSYGQFSPDGRVLAVVNSEKPNTIQLFEAATGTPMREITGKDRIVRMDFAPDSHHLVTTERDIAARLYDVSSAEQRWEFVIPAAAGAESYTSAVAFRPDGKQIAVGAPIGPDNTIRLLDSTTGEETARLTGSAWKPWTFQYTSDSRMLFGSGWDGAVRRWDLDTNQQLPRPGGVRASSICAMSGDGQHLAFADDEQQIHLVELPSGETTTKLHVDGATWGQVVFSDDGTLLAGGAASYDSVHVVVWDVANAAIRHHWKWPIGKDPHSNVEALSFSSSGNRIAAAVFRQSAAFVWDLATNQQVTQVRHPGVYGMDIDAAGTTLITAGWDKYIRVWNCETGLETKSQLVGTMKGEQPARDDTRMYGVKLSHDESFIATVDMTSSVRFFDRDLNPISVISDVGQFVYGALQIAHNDLWIGIGSSDGSVKVFEVTTRAKVWSIDDHEKHVYTVDFGARDRTIVSGAEDGVCYLWDLRVGTESTEGTPAVLFNSLMGTDGAAAYSAFRRLAETPEDTTELIVKWLAEIAATKTDDAQVRNWIVALGARDDEIVNDAKKHLLAAGPAIQESLLAEVSTGRIAGVKKIHVQDVLNSISVGPRRVVALLTDLDTPAADEAIDRLLQTTPAGTVQRMLQEAKERRKWSLRQ